MPATDTDMGPPPMTANAVQGKSKRAVGHCCALDLRRHTLRHLAVGQGQHQHDIHLLKRLEVARLRQHSAKGRQVL